LAATVFCPPLKKIDKKQHATAVETKAAHELILGMMRDVLADLQRDDPPLNAPQANPPNADPAPSDPNSSFEDLGDSEEEEEPVTDTVLEEFNSYLNLKVTEKKYGKAQLAKWRDDPTSFWSSKKQHFPLLSRVWRRIGSVKGTSSGSERIFSLGGFILMARRWNLSPESLEAIVLQHNWIKNNLI